MRGQGWRGKRVSEMTDAEIRDMAGPGPGVVKIRLLGDPAAAQVVAALLADYDGCGVEVIERSAPCPNRREAGERIYLTLRVGVEGEAQ